MSSRTARALAALVLAAPLTAAGAQYGGGPSVGSIFFSALVGLALTIGVFLLLRVFVLWYWKVNRIVTLLESIDRKLGGGTSVGAG